MNVNVKISITDEQRNTIKRWLIKKDTKAMVTRAEVNEMVNGFIQSLLDEPEAIPQEVRPNAKTAYQTGLVQFDQTKVPAKYKDKPLAWQMGWFKGRYVIQPTRA